LLLLKTILITKLITFCNLHEKQNFILNEFTKGLTFITVHPCAGRDLMILTYG